MSRLRNPNDYLGARVQTPQRTVDGNYLYRDIVIRYGKPLVLVWPDGTRQSVASLTTARRTINDAYAKKLHGATRSEVHS